MSHKVIYDFINKKYVSFCGLEFINDDVKIYMHLDLKDIDCVDCLREIHRDYAKRIIEIREKQVFITLRINKLKRL